MNIFKLVEIFNSKVSEALDKTYMSFPKHEHKSLSSRLRKDQPIYTTRVSAERNKYKVGMIVNSPIGKLKIKSIKQLDNIKEHPFYDELSEEDRNTISRKKMDLIKLVKVKKDE